MGSSSSSQTYSSSTENGYNVQDEQYSSCGWYNPFCSSSNTETFTEIGNTGNDFGNMNITATIIAAGMASILVVIFLVLTVIRRNRMQVQSAVDRIRSAQVQATGAQYIFNFHLPSRQTSKGELKFVSVNEAMFPTDDD